MDFYLENRANCSYVPVPSFNPASYSPPRLLPFISDDHLSLIAGTVAYIIASTFWHIVDVLDPFPQYKIHPSPEELKRNRISRLECLLTVIRYHVIMIGIGYATMRFMGDVPPEPPANVAIAQWANTIRYIESFIPSALRVLALDSAKLASHVKANTATFTLLSGRAGCPAGPNQALPWEYGLAWLMHRVLAPVFRLSVNLLVVDTWIYFGHRLCHVNRSLYRLVHAKHHQLYVPYAYGAAFGSVYESIFLDTLSYMFANYVSGLKTRETILFAVCATLKTIFDHCGYEFPFDPLVKINPNGPRYHDWHHQLPGFRFNYSSYLSIWDDIMGTRATLKERKPIEVSQGIAEAMPNDLKKQE